MYNMRNQFSITETSSSFSTKTITISANFKIDETTVDRNTVKFFNLIGEKTIPNENCTISCNGKDIVIELDDYPEEQDKFHIFLVPGEEGVRDKLGRGLLTPYIKSLSFSPNIATKLVIKSPIDQAALKSKKVHVEMTILDDDKYTLNLIDDTSDIVIFDTLEQIEDEEVEPPISIFDEANLTEVLELTDNTVRLEISTDKDFYKKEYITFDEHDSTSSNVYKVRAENVARIGNTLSFDLIFDEDKQYWIKARLESRKVEEYFGSWSNAVSFVVKSEPLLDPSENYLNEMLFSETIFEDEFLPLEVLSATDDAFTGDEFYIEFNKPVLVLDEMLKDSEGLIFIGKGYLIRRDI